MAVIGAGLVGAGWAIVFAQAGLSVRIYDADPHATETALTLIEAQLKELESFGLVDDPVEIAARLRPARDWLRPSMEPPTRKSRCWNK